MVSTLSLILAKKLTTVNACACDSINREYREIIEASVQYMLLTRCGFEPKEQMDFTNFRNISQFYT